MTDAMKPLIQAASEGPLERAQAEQAFEEFFNGTATQAQMAGLLIAMRTRGESVADVGTGGDGKGTLNISTATAFVVAGAGVTVAKHGNKNLSSLSGAADALTEMGVNTMVGADVVERALAEAGIGFMMAPMHHPAIKHVMPVRQELGTKTIFNILGPLTNPAGVKRQLTGAFSADLILPMAQTLKQLGSDAAWLVHGSDGTDEITITGTTAVAALSGGMIVTREVPPEDAGLPVHPFESIMGGAPADNAKAFKALLDGEQSAYRDAVLLNASAALLVAGKVEGLKAGVALARESIDSGAAKRSLETLAKITQS